MEQNRILIEDAVRLPMLALRGLTVFPDMMIHFDIGREKSVQALKEAMDRLSDREKHILRLRFFEGKTQMEVSARIGISQAQISRLEKNAIQKIKREL